MEDMIGPLLADEIRLTWYHASVRNGVAVGDSSVPTNDFVQWCAACEGTVVLLRDLNDARENPARLKPHRVYFEKPTDHAAYLLTFDEIVVVPWTDAGAFYAPYVPLTIIGVGQALAMSQGVNIVTRYDQALTQRRTP